MSHDAWKLIHVICAVLWLGPATGAYWVLIRLKRNLDTARLLLLEKTFEEVLLVEHAALAGLIASGVMMWRNMGVAWDQVPWLKTKIILVAGVMLIEIFDIALSHGYFRIAQRRAHADSMVSWLQFQRLRRVFYGIAIPVLILLIAGILWVAVLQPD